MIELSIINFTPSIVLRSELKDSSRGGAETSIPMVKNGEDEKCPRTTSRVQRRRAKSPCP